MSTETNEDIKLRHDIDTIEKIKEIVSKYTPEQPYAENALERIRLELNARNKLL